MAARSLYPRATLKKITKAHANRPMSKNVDILIFLDYMLFMRDLVREASITARQGGEKTLRSGHVRKVRERCLRKFKG